jgi:hypothetical protein
MGSEVESSRADLHCAVTNLSKKLVYEQPSNHKASRFNVADQQVQVRLESQTGGYKILERWRDNRHCYSFS